MKLRVTAKVLKGLNQTCASRVNYTDNEFVLDTNAGTLRADQLLVVIGRLHNTETLGLERIGVETAGGSILVDEHLQPRYRPSMPPVTVPTSGAVRTRRLRNCRRAHVRSNIDRDLQRIAVVNQHETPRQLL